MPDDPQPELDSIVVLLTSSWCNSAMAQEERLPTPRVRCTILVPAVWPSRTWCARISCEAFNVDAGAKEELGDEAGSL
jgi:hypothetical protein